MKIAVFAPDIPFPPVSGGRADIWRRIVAFRMLGHDVMLVNMQEASGPKAPDADALRQVDAVVVQRYSFCIRRGWLRTVRQLAMSWRVPWHAATRIPSAAQMRELTQAIVGFAPDVLWLDGPWFAVACRRLSGSLGVPIFYRSHNIEFQYIWRQAQLAPRLRDRLAWSCACIGLRRFETRAMRDSAAVYDISMDDLKFWQGQLVPNLHWLPPLPELAIKSVAAPPVVGGLVFVGNLRLPNNAQGVQWFLAEVLPRARVRIPGVTCRIVGSSPSALVRRAIAGAEGVELCSDVADTLPFILGARVLVNPVMSGSGVQVKMLDMLMSGAPIVTASQGTRGLPEDMHTLFRIADDADAFALAICEEWHAPSVDLAARAKARERFSVKAVGLALALARPGAGETALG